MYCIEESTCGVVGTFRRHGHCAPLAPRRYFPAAIPGMEK